MLNNETIERIDKLFQSQQVRDYAAQNNIEAIYNYLTPYVHRSFLTEYFITEKLFNPLEYFRDSIPYECFKDSARYTDLGTVYLDVNHLYECCFEKSRITSLIIPEHNSITSIGKSAFKDAHIGKASISLECDIGNSDGLFANATIMDEGLISVKTHDLPDMMFDSLIAKETTIALYPKIEKFSIGTHLDGASIGTLWLLNPDIKVVYDSAFLVRRIVYNGTRETFNYSSANQLSAYCLDSIECTDGFITIS